MRARVALTLAAALAATVAASPAAFAYKRRVPVPFMGCHVYVETWDVRFHASNHGGVRAYKYGNAEVSSNC